MSMSDEDMMRYLSMGTNEEALMELLRKQSEAEGVIDSTRDRDATIDAGGGNVIPNFQPIADMFIRGKEGRHIKKLEGKAANNRAQRDQDTMAWLKGQREGERQDDAIFSKDGIGFPEGDGMNMPKMPQVTPPMAPKGPMGPPGPAAAAPSPVPAATPAVPPVKPAVPPGNTGGASGSWAAPAAPKEPSNPFMPNIVPDGAQMKDFLLSLLRGNSGVGRK